MSYHSRIGSDTASAEDGGTVVPHVGNWQLVELLSEGKWASVHRARPRSRGADAPADYAIKIAKANSCPDGVAIQCLRREAVLGRQLCHEHLASVLSTHVRRFPFYVVMPYLEGVTIAAALATGRTPTIAQTLHIARQTAEGLNALHEAGWLHSDVKPGNMLLSPTGHVTLLDLGLARRIKRSASGGGDPLAGTLAYAAPEAFSSLVDLGPPSDVYGLGVTLYEMLTGGLPFAEADPAVLAACHVHREPPDPRTKTPDLSRDVVRLLRRMLDKQPARRPDFSDLVGSLADLEAEADEANGPADVRRLAA